MTIVVILGVLAGPSVVTCFDAADGMGQCLQSSMRDAGLLPAAPAAPVEASVTPATPEQPAAPTQTAVATPETPAVPTDAAAVAANAAADASDNLVAATFGLLRAEPDGSVVVAGSGTPGSEIAVYSNGALLGKTKVEPSGDWVLVPDVRIAPGGTEITLGEVGKPGLAPQSFVVAINEDQTSEPLVVASTPGTSSKVLQGLPSTPPAQVAAAEPTAPAAPAAPVSTPAPAAATASGAPAQPAAADTAASAPAAPASPTTGPAAVTPPAIASTTSPATTAPAAPAPGPSAPASAVATTQPAEPAAPATTAAAAADTVPPSAPVTAATPAPDAAPAAPAMSVATADNPASPVAVTPAPVTAATVPAPTIDAVELDGDRTFFAGSGSNGATIRLYVDDSYIADTLVSGGRWLIEAAKVLTKPDQRIRVDMLGAGSADVVARAQVDFQIKLPPSAAAPVATAEAAPATLSDALPVPAMVAVTLGNADDQRFAAGKAIIRRGDNLWTIARRVYGEGIKYTTIYQANNGQIRDPDRIYPGQVFDLPHNAVN